MARIGKVGFDRSPPPAHGQHSVAVLGPLPECLRVSLTSPPARYKTTWNLLRNRRAGFWSDAEGFFMSAKIAKSCSQTRSLWNEMAKQPSRLHVCGRTIDQKRTIIKKRPRKNWKIWMACASVHRKRQRRLLDSWNMCQGRFLIYSKKPRPFHGSAVFLVCPAQQGRSKQVNWLCNRLKVSFVSCTITSSPLFFIAYYDR